MHGCMYVMYVCVYVYTHTHLFGGGHHSGSRPAAMLGGTSVGRDGRTRPGASRSSQEHQRASQSSNALTRPRASRSQEHQGAMARGTAVGWRMPSSPTTPPCIVLRGCGRSCCFCAYLCLVCSSCVCVCVCVCVYVCVYIYICLYIYIYIYIYI